MLILMLVGVAGLQAAPGFDSFFAPQDVVGYRIASEPARDGSPSVVDQGVEGSVRLAGNPSRRWTLHGSASLFNVSRPVTLPQTGVVFPESLGAVDGGASYLHRIGDRRQWGARLSVGSASDHLFDSIAETEVQMTGSWMIPHRAQNAWFFLLSYSNNRSFLNNIPLPGIAYLWNKPEKGFRAVIGFPVLSLSYSPMKAWQAQLFLLGPTQQGVEISRRLTKALEAYAAFQRNPQLWMRTNRDNNDNRLIYDEKKTLLGLRHPLGPYLSLDLSGGRTFDRRLFEARDASRTGTPRATLANGWIIQFAFQARWGKR